MPRYRLLGKKRGTKRTGSNLVGSLGEAAFFTLLFVIGVLGLTALVVAQVNHPSPNYRLGFGFWLMVGVMVSFILIGGGGVVIRIFKVGMSSERRLALARKAAHIDLLSDAMPSTIDFPSIPRDSDLTNSPGVRLAYRLPAMHSPVVRLATITVFSVVWNIVSVVLVIVAWSSHREDQADWLLTLFALPFVGIGIWSGFYTVKQWWQHASIGPTHVEISEHPLYPGKAYDVYMSQMGQMKLDSLTLALVCDEEATFHQGTDIRTETRRVRSQEFFRETEVRIEPGSPFEQVCRITIPEDGMHSFHSSHNAVTWNLVVKGESTSWPSFERSFPVVVYPLSVEESESLAAGS